MVCEEDCAKCSVREKCETVGRCDDYEPKEYGGWIPCSERLPEEDDVKNVLVTVNKRYALYDVILLPSKSVKTEYKMGHIDAWMPMPKPYKKQGE